MAFLTVLIVGIISYVDYGGSVVRLMHGDPELNKESPGSPYPGSPKPDEQLAMTSGNVPEEFVVQEGQLHARNDDPARRYAGQEHEARHGTDADGVSAAQEQPRQLKLPKLPIPTDILDIPHLIPTRIKDILSDLPAIPTIPTDPGDIVDLLPTDPGELISDLPIPPLPTIPAIPTMPVPVPIPTSLPDLPLPPGSDLPLPTGLPPSKPKDPGDIYKLPDITEIPHKVLGLLHHAISQLSTNPTTPKYLRDVLRLILRILNRVGGGDPVPKPWPPPTLPLPVPTKTKLPLPTLPIPTIPAPTRTRTLLPPLPTLPRPTLTLPNRPKKAGDDAGQFARAARKGRNEERAGGAGGKEPLSDERRKELRDSVADEVWAAADWGNPLEASITAAMAMVSFDAIYRVAEALGRTDDDAEKERLYGLFVIVDDEEIEAAA